jgi:hypothetical protein
MPVEVHCPNPQCAKVHLVKSKYAGMRGKCPACGSWMLVPRGAPSFAVPVARVEPAVEEPAVVVEEAPPARGRHNAHVPAGRHPHEEVVEDAAVAVVEEPAEGFDAEEVVAAPPARHFSWLAVVLLVLGLLSILGVLAMPSLEGPAVSGSAMNEFLVTQNKPRALKPDSILFLGIACGAVAFFALVGLMASVFGRRFGGGPRAAGYLVTVTSLAVLLLIGGKLFEELAGKRKIEERYGGNVTVSLGLGIWEGVAAAGAAFLFFLLATTLMHRQAWAKLTFLLVLLAVAGAAGTLAYLGVLNDLLKPAHDFVWS